MTKTPKRIWLIPDGEGGLMWCDNPAPGTDMDPDDAIEYVQASAAPDGDEVERVFTDDELRERFLTPTSPEPPE